MDDAWIATASRKGAGDYRSIADALDGAIQAGQLEPGDRLPSHRDLAASLGIAITTATRAYQEAKRRGVVTTAVGRGTFVRRPESGGADLDGEGPIDLAMNSLFPRAFASDLQRVIGRLQGATELSVLFDYGPPGGVREHREACARWLTDNRLDIGGWRRVLITAGGQHAMTVAVSSLVRRRGTLMTGEWTCHGILDLARQLGVTLHGIPMDAKGIIPEALDEACQRVGSRVLYVMPAMQNPLGINMPEERRSALAEAARRNGVHVIEDDAYGFLDPLPPVAAHAPERTTYVNSMGKMLWPGVRVGLVVPARGALPQRMEGAIAATTHHAAPFMAAVVSSCIRTGLAGEMKVWKREQLAVRREAVRILLPPGATRSHPLSPHLWIPLPPKWSAAEFTARARERGVSVTSSDDYLIARRAVEPAIRLCLGSVARLNTLEHGARIVGELLGEEPPPRADGRV